MRKSRVETTEMSLQYLEKIRSKLKSLTLSESNRPSANLANSSDEHQTVKDRRNLHNKCKVLKNTRCWSPLKAKSPKTEESSDKKKTSPLLVESYSDEEQKMVFMMGTSRSQPSPKMEKRDEEKKVKKLKAKDTKLIKNFVKSWDQTEGSKHVGKVRRRWGWEKREGELEKKRTNQEAVVGPTKMSVQSQAPDLCKCGKTKNVTLVVKDFCDCDKVKEATTELRESHSPSRKRKPNTAPHLTDSLLVYKERMSRKSDRCDKVEDEVMELPVKKKEGKGVSFSKDVVFRKRKNLEDSLITLYQNSHQKKSACGLTKEQFERIKSSSQGASKVKEKLL